MIFQNTIIAGTCFILFATGCSKKEEAGSPTSTPQAADPAAVTVQKAVATAEAQTEVIKQKVGEAASSGAAQVQSLIDQAKMLIGQNKWADGLSILNKLNGQNLTTEQQSLVDTLKSQAQKGAEATAAAKSVGGLIPAK